jgi:hypothetical protein
VRCRLDDRAQVGAELVELDADRVDVVNDPQPSITRKASASAIRRDQRSDVAGSPRRSELRTASSTTEPRILAAATPRSIANLAHASASRRRPRRRARASRARPVADVANAATAPKAPSTATSGCRTTAASAIDPTSVTTAPVIPNPPIAGSVAGAGGVITATGSTV